MSGTPSAGGTIEGAPVAPSRVAHLAISGGLPGALALLPRIADEARTVRFRSVAGTSGAEMAAAFAASAEYGRARGGFERLRAPGARRERELVALRPAGPARALPRFLFALERHGRPAPGATGVPGLVAAFWSWFPGWVRWTFDVFPAALREALPVRFWTATALGCLVGGTMDVLLANGLFDAAHPQARTVAAIVLPVMFIGSYLFSVGACTTRLIELVLADRPQPVDPEAAAARALHARIQELAGLDADAPPLTPAMLRAADIGLAGPGDVPLIAWLLAGPAGRLLAGAPEAAASPSRWARVAAFLLQCQPGALEVTPGD